MIGSDSDSLGSENMIRKPADFFFAVGFAGPGRKSPFPSPRTSSKGEAAEGLTGTKRAASRKGGFGEDKIGDLSSLPPILFLFPSVLAAFLMYYPMDEVISNADREVLAKIVKFTQKQGLKGGEGGWKDFLQSHDRRFGADVSDPARRTKDMLVAFLQTFEEKHLKLFDKMIRHLNDCKAIRKFITDFQVQETPQQRLVRLTMEHPLFSRCFSFPSHEQEWIIIPLGTVSEAVKSKVMLSIDCEMVLCEDGTEAVVKVCAVDHNLEVKLDELVNPNKAVADYRTDITGIYAEDLEGVTCSLPDIQKSLKKLLSQGTILVGHSVHNDLKVLKIDHPRIIDTSYIFKCGDLLPTATPSLNNLCKYADLLTRNFFSPLIKLLSMF